METRSRKRRSINSIIPSLLTLASCSAGLTAVRYALDGDSSAALFLILAAAVLDGLDGTVARWLKATSHFGGELDSLADFVAFGVSPGLIVYYLLFDGSALQGVAWGTTLLFILCCGLRLARFNVANLMPESGKKAEACFRGIPAPGGGMLCLMPLALIEIAPEIAQHRAMPITYAVWQVLIGIMMVSNIPTLSPKKLRIPQNFRLWFLLGMFCLLLLAFEQPWHVWVGICTAYLLAIPWLAFKISRTD